MFVKGKRKRSRKERCGIRQVSHGENLVQRVETRMPKPTSHSGTDFQWGKEERRVLGKTPKKEKRKREGQGGG